MKTGEAPNTSWTDWRRREPSDVTPSEGLGGGLSITFATTTSSIPIVGFAADSHETLVKPRAKQEIATACPFPGVARGRGRGELCDPVTILPQFEQAEHQAGALGSRCRGGMSAGQLESGTDATHQVDGLAQAMRIERVVGDLSAEERRIQPGNEQMGARGSLREIGP